MFWRRASLCRHHTSLPGTSTIGAIGTFLLLAASTAPTAPVSTKGQRRFGALSIERASLLFVRGRMDGKVRCASAYQNVTHFANDFADPVSLSDKTRAGLAWTTDMAALTASTKRANAIARAFENAERSRDPARSITVDEARLIKTYVSSYRTGLRFIKHAEWLEFRPEEPDLWQAGLQVRGKVVWKRLQDAYGACNLPSKETLAIAAVLVFREHFKAAGISELRWLDESYFDAMLILVHTRIWRTSGTALQKNSIRGFPSSHNERPLVIVDEDGKEKHAVKELLDEWKFLCNKRVVTKSTDLADLSHVSPIAAAALGSRLRHHKDETGVIAVS